MLLNSGTQKAMIIDSGSTNRPGMAVSIDETGNATVEQRNTEPKTLKLDAELGERLMRDIKAAGTLSALAEEHCPKSISFGSSIYVELNGDRSPELSCSPQPDPRCAALQKDANDILQAVQQQIGARRSGRSSH
jgi:hypothetical protein